MEKVKKKKGGSLRRSFIGAVSVTFVVILVLSGITIGLCLRFQSWLNLSFDGVYLMLEETYDDGTKNEATVLLEMGREAEEIPFLVADEEDSAGQKEPKRVSMKYSVHEIGQDNPTLTPKRRIAYRASQAAMIGLPLLYSVAGILFCALWFYRKKLAVPIHILSDAAAHISEQNLDFSVSYDSGDEMDALCRSFEQMRQALYDNNRELWRQVEEQRLLQASVAHDLRNPIAIIQGYAEHLQLSIADGNMNQDKLVKTADNIMHASKRLERYTNSIRDINRLEELEIHRTSCTLNEFVHEVEEDFAAMAGGQRIEWNISESVAGREILLDRQVFSRILENIFTNALRFANETITVGLDMREQHLVATIADDGAGFPVEILETRERYLFSDDKEGEHMGMGLTVSRILCQKHGGELKLANRRSGGAKVTVFIKV